MKVLDATFFIDYFDGTEVAAEYLLARTDETFIFPLPAYAEALVGKGNAPNGDVDGARADLSWGEVCTVDEQTAITAGEIADEIGPEGPFLSSMDALIAAVGREVDAPVVSRNGDLTHPETKEIVEVEEYR